MIRRSWSAAGLRIPLLSRNSVHRLRCGRSSSRERISCRLAAGLTIAALDVELCDCFLEYGQTTAEMALLFAFVLFGSSLIWSGLQC